jgi:hypothetical protein
MGSTRRPLVVIGGSVAQRPGRPGHAWVFLQYLLGFRQLGWDVLFLDRLTPQMTGASDDPMVASDSRRAHVDWFLSIMRRAGPETSYSLAISDANPIGLSCADVLRVASRADLLLDFNGFLGDEELAERVPLRVFVDIDPGFNQMWHELGLAKVLDGYDAYVTVAQRIGKPDCLIPTCGQTWITTLPPVVLDAWPVAPPRPHGAVTSIATWRGPFAPVEYSGRRYGLRVHEFRGFTRLPEATGERFELALDVDPADRSDIEQLARDGWRLVDPMSISDLDAYERFIATSKAEFSVAKEMYVKTQSGWISDRTACYLATGRPVILQDTGQRATFGGAEGAAFFATPDEARDVIRRAAEQLSGCSTGARDLAERLFAAPRVLTGLLEDLSVPHRPGRSPAALSP